MSQEHSLVFSLTKRCSYHFSLLIKIYKKKKSIIKVGTIYSVILIIACVL